MHPQKAKGAVDEMTTYQEDIHSPIVWKKEYEKKVFNLVDQPERFLDFFKIPYDYLWRGGKILPLIKNLPRLHAMGLPIKTRNAYVSYFVPPLENCRAEVHLSAVFYEEDI